jgi:S-adenosylmethionine:tRNA ribosyltransferase-isomerase
MLKVSDLDFKYPQELVAVEPAPRGTSRILSSLRDREVFEELTWTRFLNFFKSGDTLVLNQSKVLPARLVIKKDSGKTGEVLFLRQATAHIWDVMTGQMNLKVDKVIDLPGEVKARVLKTGRVARLEILSTINTVDYLNEFGQVPLPPYITQIRKTNLTKPLDKERYQNTWANDWGSVAAPTAGLHFTDAHLNMLKHNGVQVEFITLHVGAGTFLPLDEGPLDEVELHTEWVSVSQKTCDAILKTQAAGKKVWACGTTVTRALESAVWASGTGGTNIPMIKPYTGETALFISPGYKFQVVEGLLTNFHQPESSLLALVAAFGTRLVPQDPRSKLECIEKVKRAYNFAIQKKFRLFSYGDLTVWH